MTKPKRSSELSGFYKAAAKMGGIQLATFGISFIGSIVLTRELGPEGRGIIAWFVSLSSITMVIVQLGMNMVNKRYVAESPELAGDMAIFTLRLMTITSLVAAPFFLLYGLTHEVGATHIPMLIIALLAVPFMATAPAIGNLLLALHRTGSFNLSMSTQKIVNTLIILFLAAIGTITPMAALIVLVCSYVLQAGLAFHLVRGEIAKRQHLGIRALVSRLQLKAYMAYNYVSSVLLLVANMIMPMLLAAWDTLDAAGMLAACAVLTDAVYRVYWMVSNYAFPKLMSLKDEADKRRLKSSLMLVSSLGMGLVAIMLAVSGSWLVPLLFGEEFIPAVSTFRVLCLYMALMSVQSTLYAIIHSETAGRQVMVSPFWMLVVMVGAAYILIPAYGSVGGAWALSAGAAAGVASAALYLWRVRRKKPA